MASYMASPCGLPSDEEGETPVFESTAAELGSQTRPHMPEISIISPGLEPKCSISAPKAAPGIQRQGSSDEGGPEKVKVYVRIRPVSKEEKERAEEQGCVNIQNEDTLLLKAPKDSQTMKSAERGIAQSVHKFTFSKIFGPETSQQEFFENTMKKMVSDVLHGENRLLYTYGVTNSGKTYTIQGTGQEAGLLPRALVSVFRKLQGRLHGAVDLKPVMYQDVRRLEPHEVRAEEQRRDSLLKEDDCNSSRRGGGNTMWDSGVGGLSATSHINTQLEDSDSVCLEPDGLSHSGGEGLEEGVQYSVWVSFYEIYNEFLYDLLEAPPSAQSRKRATLKLSDDKSGNPYVKDLTWIQVRSAEEAWRVLRAGRRHQSFASTHLNQNSSRSHSIFSMRLLHVRPEADPSKAMHISELSVCDLAGSERCKHQQNGERLKEANNINSSLHTLGRCITALRHNQNRSRPPQVVPFRDSKLTRVLQGFFCGRGSSSMVVNINPCAGIYDETLQALKFSAIATQLVHGPSTKTRVAYILSLLREPSAPFIDSTFEEEDEESDDEEGDMTMLNTESLLRAIDVLKRAVQRQREEKEALEAEVREQVVSEMTEVMNGMQNDFSEALEMERTRIEEMFETKIKTLQNSLKSYYSQELEERDEQIAGLTAALEEAQKAGQPVAASSSLAPAEAPLAAEPRRSQRLCTSELSRMRAELDHCRAELHMKTHELRTMELQVSVPGPTATLTRLTERRLEEGQKNLRRLRSDLQRLVADLQSGERACCRNTGGERLRQALSSADTTLLRQDQILVELQNNLQLVKADLRRKAQPQLPPSGSAPAATPRKKRACGAAATANAENQPPEKRSFLHSLFPACTPTRRCAARANEEKNFTPYKCILRSRQQSPPPSPAFTPRAIRGKY